MAFNEELKDRVMDLLIPFGDVTERKMFGGCGIFEAGAMFALIAADDLYFKVDDSNRARYEALGSPRFGNMPYYRVPLDILDDQPELHRLVEESVAAARAARRKKS